MEKDSDDCEQWLLPQFLTDDDEDLFAELKKKDSPRNGGGKNTRSYFGAEFKHDFGYGFGPFGPQSDLSSPGEGSTETESDEEDFMTSLTQKFAQSALYDSALASENKRGRGLSGSPQSTLCGALCGRCGSNHGSGHGSPNCPSQVSSQTGMKRNDAALDLLYAAAGEVARMRTIEGAAAGFHPNKNGLFVPSRKATPNNPFRPDHPTHLFDQQHLKAAQFQQQQMMQQQQEVSGAWSRGKFQFSQIQQMLLNSGKIGAAGGNPPDLSISAWPTLQQAQRRQQQQQPGSGMRAVFLENHYSKRGCAGTGVFLPRRIGTPAPETRKKSGCSTVLLPDRVVQALNLNLKLEAVDSPAQPRYNGALRPDCGSNATALRYRNSRVQQKREQQAVVMNHHHHHHHQVQEIRLPQEWTY